MILHLDFETRSTQELRGQKSVSVYNYCQHESTSWLMLGWAIDDRPVEVWFPEEPMPDELQKAFNSDADILAFNSAFERLVLKHKVGIDLSASRFQDPQPSARYLSLPASLDDVSEILDLQIEMRKDKRGDKLIDIFSKPSKKKKKRGEPVEYYFKDKTTNPDEWLEFVEYCKRDVIAEREIARRLKLLKVFPLPPKEREIWLLDQKINDRGICVDIDFVQKALKLATREKEEAIAANDKRTGLENSNSNKQLIEWCRTQGYSHTSLEKDVVKAQLEFNENITPLCREVLEARKSASSTTYKKLPTILRQVSSDGRLRGSFMFMGSPRCGRWSSGATQLHNMARPNDIFEDPVNIDSARQMIYQEDYDGLREKFGPMLMPHKEDKDYTGTILLVVKYTIRTAFVAAPGKRLEITDLNAIETRVGAYMAECKPLLEVFHQKRCPYLSYAVKKTGITYEKLDYDRKNKADPVAMAAAKTHRQRAKPAVLQCIYRAGGGGWGVDKKGNKIKTGLWGYLAKNGIHVPQEEAHDDVRVFRESYKEIPEMWEALEKAIIDVVNGVMTVRKLGPNGCIRIDKLVIQGDHPKNILRIQLPSGRYLHYFDATIRDTKMPWTQKDAEGNEHAVYRPALWYWQQNQTTKVWSETSTHGGKIFENIDQGWSRDVLAEKMLLIEQIMPIVIHVHDECVGEPDDDIFSPTYREMEEMMSQSVWWVPDLPLAAEGASSPYYRKA